MASLSFHWCCILRHFCLGMCLHARESDLCHWAFQIYYFFAFSPFLIHLWCQWLTWSDLTWSDAEIINAGQIFAHTFLALFLYELLLAENSYQTPWLPKRKNRSQLKEQLLKKKNKQTRRSRPFNIWSYCIIGPSYKWWSPFYGPYISLSFMQDSCLVSEPTSLCQDQLQRTQKQKVSIHIVNCTIDIIMSSKYQKMKLVSKPSSPSGQSLHFLLFLLSASWDAICGMIILHSIKIVTPICMYTCVLPRNT